MVPSLKNFFSFNVKLSLFLYFFFVSFLHFAKSGIQVQVLSWTNMTSLLLGGVTCFLIPMIVESLFKSHRSRQYTLLAFYTGYVFLAICHYRTESFFDIDLFFENIGILFYKESAEIVSSRFKGKDIFFFLFFFSIIFFNGLIKRKFINPSFVASRKKGILYLGLYFLLIFSGFNRFDEVGVFTSDAYSYLFKPLKLNSYAKSILKEDYPFIDKELHAVGASQMVEDPPHIFVIPIESFNANFAESKTKDGRFYTPFFNRLIKKGIYVENFFGNSIQTAKGFFGILCSMVPKTRGKVFEKNYSTNFLCLPEILKRKGYTNLYYQSFGNLNFDNKLRFYQNNNFDKIEALSLGDISEKERAENVWGWGPQDNLLYKDIFKKMDKLNKAQEEKKFFVSMLGVSSHMMFDQVPKNQRMLFPENRTKKEKYSNAIRVVDKYLEVFFKELEKRDYLKNSIVIITGDHSFPVGEHGLYHSERGFYNEFFKVPLLILWKDKLRPQRIKKRSYSQVDISPTILDLIGVKTSNHFQGVSIFKKKKVLQYLVQPYSGKYLSIVDYPLKYVFHEKSRTEYLFDLEKDQGESENLISLILSGEIKKKVDFFREKLGYFYVNDILIEENRVWKD